VVKMWGEKQSNEDQNTANFSVSLHRIITVDLLHALSAERKRSRAEYCAGSRCLGRWFRLERRLRHSRQGWLQGKYRPGAGDIVQRRCGGDEAHPRSARWTMHSCGSQLWWRRNHRSGNGYIGCWFGLHRGPHADAGENEADDGKRFPSDLSKSTAIKKTADGFTYL